MVNKQGQTRLGQYFEHQTVKEREALESEVVRKCLARGEHQVYTCMSSIIHPFLCFFYDLLILALVLLSIIVLFVEVFIHRISRI